MGRDPATQAVNLEVLVGEEGSRNASAVVLVNGNAELLPEKRREALFTSRCTDCSA